jgi:tetratricopeptide (TPR) repeat protein
MRQQANLRVRVLGVLDVAVDGHEVAPIELASRKGRTLLRLLLARRGVVVPAEVLPVEAAAGQAEGALAARLLVEDETGAGYRFVNDLVREVLYATSPRPTRVARHRRLAGLLADRPETAAGHAAAAGDWAAAARAWMAAAATAARSYANRDAERLLGQAVEAATRPGDPALEAAARLDRGQALVALGDYPAAFADQEQALRLATAHGLDRLEAAALEQLGWTAYYSRDHQAASELTPRPASWPSGRWPPPGPPRRRCCWPPACATPKGTWPGPGRPSTPCSASPTRPPRRPA